MKHPGFAGAQPGKNRPALLELLAGLLLVIIVGLGVQSGATLSYLSVLSAAAVYAGMALLLAWHWPSLRDSLGAASRVTVIRGALIAVVAGMGASPDTLHANSFAVAALCLLALALDGVDGWVARRTASASAFGARFDMELDAFFILVLCVAVLQLGKTGPWVLAIGAMRYVFVLAMWPLPWLAKPLPPSLRRKAVCVAQVAILLICLLPFVVPPFSSLALMMALAALGVSFALDVRWLRHHAPRPAISPRPSQGVRP